MFVEAALPSLASLSSEDLRASGLGGGAGGIDLFLVEFVVGSGAFVHHKQYSRPGKNRDIFIHSVFRPLK